MYGYKKEMLNTIYNKEEIQKDFDKYKLISKLSE